MTDDVVADGPAPTSMKRRLGRAWALTTLTNGTLGLVIFAVSPWAANVLGPDGRGRLTAIQLLPQMLADLSSVGLAFSIVHYGSARRGSLRTLLSWSVKPTIIGTAVMFTIGQLAVLPIVGDHGSDVRFMRIYLLMCPLTAVIVLASESLRAAGDFGRWNVVTFARGMSWPIALFAGVIRVPSIGRIVMIHLVLTAALMVVLVVGVWRRTRLARGVPAVDANQYVRYGLLSAASTVPRTANAKLDQVVMSFRVSDRDLGLYSAAVGWSAITLPIMRGFTGVAMPHVSEAEPGQVPARVRHILTASLVATMALVGLGIAFTLALWHVRYSQEFNAAFGAALILVPGGLLLEYNAILGNVLRSLHRPGLVAVLEVVVLVVSTGALFVVLNHNTVTGPALVSLATYLGACVLYVWFIARELETPARSLFDFGLVGRLIHQRTSRPAPPR
ncbi:hypothetical protein BH24ACT5_BH24ACT5_17120 [soil metagenome]